MNRYSYIHKPMDCTVCGKPLIEHVETGNVACQTPNCKFNESAKSIFWAQDMPFLDLTQKDTMMIKENMYKALNGKTVTVHVSESENLTVVMIQDSENNVHIIDEFKRIESEETNG